MKTLDTGIKNARNVKNYFYGEGSLSELSGILQKRREEAKGPALFFVDEYFGENSKLYQQLPMESEDLFFSVKTSKEPTTEGIDGFADYIKQKGLKPSAIVAVGGGITLDTGKAVSNLLGNEGKAADYQGWDLLKNPGVFKIGIPTVSGTGSEATRTCVMTNAESGLKLGMNSDYTVFDQVILDPQLTRTVPRDQYFWTGMDSYIHCIEALAGHYRNAIGDAYSREAVSLCRQVFNSEDMQADESREKLMVASYLGGCSIAMSYVGVVHPFSAGLSVVLGLHHCVSNCIVMRAMEEFYPKEFKDFWAMAEKQKVSIPEGVCRELSDEDHERLYLSTVVHEKPLTNALGPEFGKTLTREKVREVFMKM